MIDCSSAMDQREFDRLDEVFTPDAYIDPRDGRNRRPLPGSKGVAEARAGGTDITVT